MAQSGIIAHSQHSMNMKKKKIAVIGTVGIPAKYGGFETLTEHLVDELNEDMDITVYCSGKKYSKQEQTPNYKGTKLIFLPLEANGTSSILYDCISILHALFYADVLLILGVSGGLILPFVRLLTNKKIIVSIDGIEWKRNKWGKMARWYLWAAEWLAVKCSHADIADNEAIQDYTAIRYGTLSSIIEYGADHVMHVKPTVQDKKLFPFLAKSYAFKVCRIEPENNIHTVLEAFATMPEYPLVMVGNWNISAYGQQLKTQYGECANITLLDPIYEQRTLDLLRGNCLVYVHGHSAGGTNPSLVEAMFLGLPVVAFDVSYNRTTTENRAFYFKTPEDIRQLVMEQRVPQLKDNGMLMQQIASRRYTWKVIADKYAFLIRKVSTPASHKSLSTAVSKKISPNDFIDFELGHLFIPSHFYEKR